MAVEGFLKVNPGNSTLSNKKPLYGRLNASLMCVYKKRTLVPAPRRPMGSRRPGHAVGTAEEEEANKEEGRSSLSVPFCYERKGFIIVFFKEFFLGGLYGLLLYQLLQTIL